MLRSLIALATALALFWSLAAAPALALTLEEEREIGRKALREVKAELPLIKDPDVLSYLRRLGARLAAQVKDDPFEYHFYVADLGEMNAFALPGGWIFIFRGMITSLESEAELAGVMAHEMSHVHYRHIASRMKRSGPVTAATLAGMLAGMILGGLAGVPQLGQAITMGSVAAGIQKQLAFSREDEKQADYGAFQIVSKAGYPPKEMERSFARIWREQRYTMPQVPTYLLTHPTSPERMETLQNLVRRHPFKGSSYDNGDFLRIRTRLIALYDSEDSAERALRHQLEKRGDLHELARYGLGLLEMRRSRFALALKQLQQVGGRWADSPAVIRARGICHLRLGEYGQAQALLARVLVQDPKDQEALLALGQAYLQTGRLSQARDTFRRVLALDGENSQARYDLGVALGRLGHTAEASLQLGLAFKARGNLRAARYHLERALKGLAGRPQLQAQARKALDEMDRPKKKKRPPAHQQGAGFARDRQAINGLWITDSTGITRRLDSPEPTPYPERR